MAESQSFVYDVVNYPTFAMLYTHPNRLATVARLLGLQPAPVERCRVLEIGCFDGVNLMSMAVGLPNSEFVGVDLAGTAIARGAAMAAEVGLTNVSLRHASILDMAPDFGQFDYIIVHGLYSWVPVDVCKQIMAICKGSLTPNGVAYISYNTYPGCYNRLMLREMMQFHNRDFHDPGQKMQQGLNLLKLLANSLEKDTEPYSQFLKGELERLGKRPLESLYHDEMADVFRPFYFHQFMDDAKQNELQYLGEADFFDMFPRGMTSKAMEVLEKIGDDIVLREQYMDFMRGRHFRKTLLCHEGVKLNRNLTADCVKSYHVSIQAKAGTEKPNLDPAAKESFENTNGAAMSSADPLARSLFWYLVENEPEPISFEQLVKETTARAQRDFGVAPKPEAEAANEITEFVWVTYRAGLLDLHVYVPPLTIHVSEKPVASPLARWQARRSDIVSTLHHRSLKLISPVQRGIVALLDGSRDRAALHADLLKVFASGTLDLPDEEGKKITDMAVIGKIIDGQLEGFLKEAGRSGVLIA